MEYWVLGPTEVVGDDGRVVPLGGPQRRALLIALLLRAGHTCSPDWLAEALWGDEAIDDAAGRLHPLISRLRAALAPDEADRGGNRSVIVSVPGGYRLMAEPESIDAERFEKLVAGAESAAAHDPARAADLAATALALWRGPALADVADRPFARGEAARLEERRLSALEVELGALVDLGRHREAVPRLRHLVGQHPLRERLWALLMLALYRDGRQADALRAYGEVRAQLIEELGLEPGRELRELEVAILQQSPSLDRPAALGPAAPGPPRGGPRKLPPALVAYDRMPFVGRASELEALLAAWRRATTDGRQVVLLAGEPGVGKTRLATEIARQVAEEGGLVLAGRCDEGLAFPYQPFVEALRQHALGTRDGENAMLGQHPADLARLVPELADRLPEAAAPLRSDAETERYRLFDAVASWLSAVSADRPTLLVLDDLHWAAAPTLLLVRHLGRSPLPMRLLVVATYRETEVDRAHPLTDALADLRRLSAVERIALEGLTEREVGELLTATGIDLPEDDLATLARSVLVETAGNPLFVRELVRHLTESADASRRGDLQSLLGHGVPEGVRDVVSARLARLSPEATLVLERAAVVGTDVDLALLGPLTGLRDDALDDALDEVLGAGLFVTVPGSGISYRFAHALVRSAVYDGITPSRRARLHAGVAEALEATYPADKPDARLLDVLADHWARAAGAGHGGRAIDFAERAGRRALAMLAYETAASRFTQALDLLARSGADDARRLELLLARGEALASAGDIASAKADFLAAMDAADAAADPQRMASAALGYGITGVTASVVDAQVVALLERALEALPPDDGSWRARAEARLAAELYFSREEERRRELSEHAVAMAERIGDADALAAALSAHHYVLWGPDGLDERVAIAARLRELAAGSTDTELLMQAHRWSIIDLLELGDIETADRHIDEYAALATELRQPVYRWWAGVFQAMRLLFRGQFDDAAVMSEQAWRAGRRSTDAALQFYGLQTGAILRERGQLEGVEAVALAMVERFPAVPAWRCAMAVLYTDLGRLEDAARELDDIAAHDFADLPRDLGWLPAMANLADVCAAVGDVDRARLVFSHLEPYAHRNVVVGAAVLCHGSAARPLGRLATVLGDDDRAVALYEQAIDANRAMGAAPFLALAEQELGDLLLRSGPVADRARAERLLDSAAATAERLGMTVLASRVEASRPTRRQGRRKRPASA